MFVESSFIDERLVLPLLRGGCCAVRVSRPKDLFRSMVGEIPVGCLTDHLQASKGAFGFFGQPGARCDRA
jgi:hypothetical protein